VSTTCSISEAAIDGRSAAARVADRTAFFSVEPAEDRDASPHGVLIEIGETLRIFTSPSDPRTEAYVTGRFG